MGAILAGCLTIIALIVGLSALFGLVFMLAWNAVAVPVFDAPKLDFWQAWAVWILVGLIGGAFRSVVSR